MNGTLNKPSIMNMCFCPQAAVGTWLGQVYDCCHKNGNCQQAVADSQQHVLHPPASRTVHACLVLLVSTDIKVMTCMCPGLQVLLYTSCDCEAILSWFLCGGQLAAATTYDRYQMHAMLNSGTAYWNTTYGCI